MKETGIVHAVENDGFLVKLKRHSACLGCKQCSLSSDGDMIIKAVAGEKVKPGDRVTVEIDSSSIVKAIAVVYLLPAVAFLAGVSIFIKIAPLIGVYNHKEIISVSLGIAFLGIALLFARRYGVKKHGDYTAKITKIA